MLHTFAAWCVREMLASAMRLDQHQPRPFASKLTHLAGAGRDRMVTAALMRSGLRPVEAGQSASHSTEQLGRVMRADLALI